MNSLFCSGLKVSEPADTAQLQRRRNKGALCIARGATYCYFLSALIYQYRLISRYVKDAVQLTISSPTSDSIPQTIRSAPVG